MSKWTLIGATLLAVLVCVGCGTTTTIQKGSAVGAGAGAATGATVGHFLTSLGGGKGALVGVTLGAATGALAADAYYETDSEELVASKAENEALAAELEASHAQVEELGGQLENELAQREALLEAHEKLREEMTTMEPVAGELTGDQGSAQPNEEIVITILSEVLFSSGRAKLTAEGKSALAEAARDVRQRYPDAVVEVRGHTDNVPIRYSGYKSNWELSCARAMAVVEHLIEQEGFDRDRLSIVGFGDTRPVASNDTPDGRRLNRRAEIVVKPQAVQVAARELQ